MLLIILIVTACNTSEEAPPPACDSARILMVPIATRPADPDIYVPPTLPNRGCYPTAVPDGIAPATIYPEQFTTAEITNLSLDSGYQKLAAAAVGDDMMTVAWINDGDIYVAFSHGGGHFQVRRVDSSNSVSLAFSSANRLHMAYERNGEIYYRIVDQGIHPADSDFFSTAGSGTTLQSALDARQWAHVIYQSDRNIQHAFDRYAFYWQIEMLGAGERTTVINGQPRSSAGSRDFASPDQIYVGLNAVRWGTTRISFDAGLKQTVNVANPNGILALEAHGLGESTSDLTLCTGIDLTGNNNPKGGSVIWSAAAAPPAFSLFYLSVHAAGNTMALFLETPLNTPAVSATTVYDEVTTAISSLTNNRFEAPFILQESFTVPAGWVAYVEDSGTMPINGRDEYVVYAASHLCWHMYYPDWQGNDPLPSSFLAAWVKAGQSPPRR